MQLDDFNARLANALGTLREYATDSPTMDLGDAVSEIADAAVPVYTSEIFETLTDDRVWTQDVSDFEPLRDMQQGAIAAIYLAIEEHLYDSVPDRDARHVGDAFKELP